MSLLVLVLLLVSIYRMLDPAENGFFPACPFHSLTGLQCPGCGSQRAVHHLLNFEFAEAFEKNSLLVVAIPYVLLGLYYDRVSKPSVKNEQNRKRYFGRTAIYLALAIILGFWILRNV